MAGEVKEIRLIIASLHVMRAQGIIGFFFFLLLLFIIALMDWNGSCFD